MANEDRHEQVEAARIRAELAVSELWLRYVALGGNGDLFDVDAYLAGLLPLSNFDQNALAVAVNERLEEIYRAARVPLDTPTPDAVSSPALDLRDAVAALLDSGDSRGSAPSPSSPSAARPQPPRTTGSGEADAGT